MAAWRNGNASDYDRRVKPARLGNQEIAGSTPAVVISFSHLSASVIRIELLAITILASQQ